MKTVVFTSTSLPEVSPTCSGDPIVPEYKNVILDNGSVGVEVTGHYDRDKLIQESLPAVLIYNILERAETDPTVLNRYKATFADITDSPKSLLELQNRTLETYDKFSKLPLEFRKLFDNNVHTFIESLHNGTAEDSIRNFIKLHHKEFNVSLNDTAEENIVSKGDVE